MVMEPAKIVRTQDTCFGKPRFDGTRLTVSFVLGLVRSGVSDEELLREYPTLKLEHLATARDLISTLTMNVSCVSSCASRVGGGGSATEPLGRSATGVRGVPPISGFSSTTALSERWRASYMSSAWRMWLMCSGVVPQQPPTIRAPASRNLGTSPAK